jgi:hypothetical protein
MVIVKCEAAYAILDFFMLCGSCYCRTTHVFCGSQQGNDVGVRWP